MADDAYDFESLAVGAAGDGPSPKTKDIASPIHLSATFGLDSAGYPDEGYTYSRFANPTRDALQDRLATLSNATHTLAGSSGIATIATVCISLLRPGDRVVASDSLFGGTTTLFEELADRFGVDVSYVDTTDLDAVADSLDTSTELVWVETPTNPLLHVCDIKALSDLAGEYDATFAVDNTFATPYGQRPLELGADLSVYTRRSSSTATRTPSAA